MPSNFFAHDPLSQKHRHKAKHHRSIEVFFRQAVDPIHLCILINSLNPKNLPSNALPFGVRLFMATVKVNVTKNPKIATTPYKILSIPDN